MSDDVYHRLAKVLDTLPSGFPSTESGVEIKLLKKVFRPEEADLFCDLKMIHESAEQVAERTERPLEGLDAMLESMWKRGQVFGIDFGTVKVYRMLPWLFGIYEFQVDRLDREFCELHEEYMKIFGKDFFTRKPQLMQVVPVESEIAARQQALPFELVSSIIESGQSFAVAECICKKEKRILDRACNKPLEICMGIAPVPGAFDTSPWGRPVSKEDAYAVLRKAEKNALVHLTWNMQGGHFFICNCCGCCCHVLESINERGARAVDVVNSHYYARIDPDTCSLCSTCADERCQIGAIEEGEDACRVIQEKCIGCGVCVSTCPSEAIELVRKEDADLVSPPLNEDVWQDERAKQRGVDYSKFK
jgi:electron transport complex protein RnfB